MNPIRARDNPKVKRWARLARDARFRRSEGRALIEGPHLVQAALAGGLRVEAMLVSEDAAADPETARLAAKSGKAPISLSDKVFRQIVDTETPQGIAAEIVIPASQDVAGNSVFLEGVQDPGNVGAILRSAAAFGIPRVLHDLSCADPWSPKVLRAGAGAHFALSIAQAAAPPEGKLVCAVAHHGQPLPGADLSGPICWVFGAEGRGVSRELEQRADLRVTIPLEEGTESLNVAAAAAVCFYEAYRRKNQPPVRASRSRPPSQGGSEKKPGP